jgi:hypothetical protein
MKHKPKVRLRRHFTTVPVVPLSMALTRAEGLCRLEYPTNV